jgi:hypothetical protein
MTSIYPRVHHEAPTGNANPFLIYENNKGVLQVGECDGLQQLKIKRMLFKKQITKSFILPEKNFNKE